jgi:uncharacterized protein
MTTHPQLLHGRPVRKVPWWLYGAIALVAIVALASAALFAVSFYYAGRLYDEAFRIQTGTNRTLTVLDVNGSRITFDTTRVGGSATVHRPGTWGIDGEHGRGQVGEIVADTPGSVVRGFQLIAGTIEVGDAVRFDTFVWRGNPLETRGIPFREVHYDSELGPLSAWHTEGWRNTWVILIHGKGASPDEALRILPVVHELGFPALGITYRNDPDAPRDLSNHYEYGRTEWRDVEAAVRFAMSGGAEEVVLYGFSMGGALSLSLLEHSDQSQSVAAIVLDAPMLSIEAAARDAAAEKGLPDLLTHLGLWIADWRYSIDWDAVDYRDQATDVRLPTLIRHGDADDRAPVEVSEQVAAENPTHITLVVFPGAGHVQSWNMYQERYEAEVRSFLEVLLTLDDRATATP